MTETSKVTKLAVTSEFVLPNGFTVNATTSVGSRYFEINDLIGDYSYELNGSDFRVEIDCRNPSHNRGTAAFVHDYIPFIDIYRPVDDSKELIVSILERFRQALPTADQLPAGLAGLINSIKITEIVGQAITLLNQDKLPILKPFEWNRRIYVPTSRFALLEDLSPDARAAMETLREVWFEVINNETEQLPTEPAIWDELAEVINSDAYKLIRAEEQPIFEAALRLASQTSVPEKKEERIIIPGWTEERAKLDEANLQLVTKAADLQKQNDELEAQRIALEEQKTQLQLELEKLRAELAQKAEASTVVAEPQAAPIPTEQEQHQPYAEPITLAEQGSAANLELDSDEINRIINQISGNEPIVMATNELHIRSIDRTFERISSELNLDRLFTPTDPQQSQLESLFKNGASRSIRQIIVGCLWPNGVDLRTVNSNINVCDLLRPEVLERLMENPNVFVGISGAQIGDLFNSYTKLAQRMNWSTRNPFTNVITRLQAAA